MWNEFISQDAGTITGQVALIILPVWLFIWTLMWFLNVGPSNYIRPPKAIAEEAEKVTKDSAGVERYRVYEVETGHYLIIDMAVTSKRCICAMDASGDGFVFIQREYGDGLRQYGRVKPSPELEWLKSRARELAEEHDHNLKKQAERDDVHKRLMTLGNYDWKRIDIYEGQSDSL